MSDCIITTAAQIEVITELVTVEVETAPIVVELVESGLITVPATPAYQLFIIEIDGQIVFNLPYAIANPDKSRLYLNGQKQIYGLDYVVNASVLNYLGVALETTDYLEIYW